MMYDAAFRDVGGIQCATLFRFQRLMLFFGEGCRFQRTTLSTKAPSLCVEHKDKEMRTFSYTFREQALLLDGFLRDIDPRIHAIIPSDSGKIRPSYFEKGPALGPKGLIV